MKRLSCLCAFIILILFSLSAQIASVEVDKGKESNVSDIIIVFKMHFDIGYTDLAESVLQKYTTSMIKETLESVEKTDHLPKSEQFVWTLPGWPMKYIQENIASEYKSDLDKAMKNGRFKVHALPFTIQTESSDLETLVRSMSYSSQINRQYNQPLSRGAKMTDVPSHSWVLPTLLAQSGVKILHIGCNAGSTSPDVPSLFWWEGPDGSRVLTINWAEYYGSGILPPDGWKHKTWLAMIHTHENTGAPSPEEVATILNEARTKAPNANIKIGELEDFYDALMKENPQIPVIKGDMPDTWIHGYMSMPKAIKTNKLMQRLIYNTETLNTLLGQWGAKEENIAPYINKAIEQTILFDEHTFGMAMSHGDQGSWSYGDQFIAERAQGEFDYIEASWYEKGNKMHVAQQQILPPFRRALKCLANAVNVDGRKIVVYNPLAWERSGIVTFHMGVYSKNFEVKALKDESTGETFNIDNIANRVSFYAHNIPSNGYKTYTILTEPVANKKSSCSIDKSKSELENDFFKIIINPQNGSLLSVWDKKQRKEIVDKNSTYGFGEFIHEKFGQAEIDRYNQAYVKSGHHGWADLEMARPENKDLHYQLIRGTVKHITYQQNLQMVSATAFCKTTEGNDYTLTYSLCENSPYLQINWGIRNKPAEPQPEGGWLAFPFQVKDPTFHLGRTGAIVNPATDFIKSTNHDYFFLNTGLAIVDKKGNGAGLNTPQAPGVSLDRPGLFRFSGEFIPKQPNVFVNLFNNQWGTNFTEWIEGAFSANVYIWSVNSYANESSLITPIEETRVPLMGVYTESDGGNIPSSAKGIELSRKGVLVTAFGPNIDGKGDILRLWEQSGTAGRCTVTIPNASYKTAYLCNLRGEATGKSLAIKNGKLEVELHPYQPLSIILNQ